MTTGVTRPLILCIGILFLPACSDPSSRDLITSGPLKEASVSASGLQPDGTYVLSADEMALGCRELSGRMQVRILEIRDFELSRSSSFAARGLQKVVVPIFGGTRRGADPVADYRHDRAMLEAYNRRLAEKGCKTFDLEKELQPKPAAEAPVLVRQ